MSAAMAAQGDRGGRRPEDPVLEMRVASRAAAEDTEAEDMPPAAPVELVLRPGDLAVVWAPGPPEARALTELLVGLRRPADGVVRVLGHDWADLSRAEAEALRGRIGHGIPVDGWLPHLTVAENVVLPRLHHDPDTPEEALLRRAEELSRDFGLEGLPDARPAELRGPDLARAACVRAFLGDPPLLVLESPFEGRAVDEVVAPMRAALDAACGGYGAAALWFTRSRLVWDDPGFPVTHRLRLDENAFAEAAVEGVATA